MSEMTATEHITKNASVLMSELQFTLDDLHANRSGQLSDRQFAYLSLDRRKNLALGGGLLIGLVLATTTLLFFGFRDGNLVLQGLGVALMVCMIAASWIVGINMVRSTLDLFSSEIDVVEGKAQHVVRQVGHAQAGSVRIGDSVEVPTQIAAFTAFEPGTTYRLYRTSHTHRLLSVEVIE